MNFSFILCFQRIFLLRMASVVEEMQVASLPSFSSCFTPFPFLSFIPVYIWFSGSGWSLSLDIDNVSY